MAAVQSPPIPDPTTMTSYSSSASLGPFDIRRELARRGRIEEDNDDGTTGVNASDGCRPISAAAAARYEQDAKRYRILAQINALEAKVK